MNEPEEIHRSRYRRDDTKWQPLKNETPRGIEDFRGILQLSPRYFARERARARTNCE